MQQTPNPEAQEPDAVPPLSEAHSALVRHVPLKPLVPKHNELANRTMENSDKTVRTINQPSILSQVHETQK